MADYKKLTFIFAGIVGLFLAINAITWFGFVKPLFYGNNSVDIVGESGRVGYTSKGFFPRKIYTDLPKKHIDFKDYKNQKIDIITIGDSFSKGGGGGKNSFYQDYIATYNNKNVLNIKFEDFDLNPELHNNFHLVFMLLNAGYFDKIKPKYLIYQSVERHCIERMDIDVDQNLKLPKTSSHAEEGEPFPKNLPFVNIANLKYLTNSILYNFSDNAFGSQIYMKKLDKPLFSSKYPTTLLFYYKDLDRIANSTDERVKKTNDNLNLLSAKLKEKGIKLYFMPTVDKYDLYSPYIIRNTHPQSVFFEKLRPLKKDYEFIDTKEILSKELEKGTKDVFYSDDTHWSYKASEAIFKKIKF